MNDTFNDLTKWKQIPIESVIFTTQNAGNITFYNFEEDSNWSIDQILEENDRGGQTAVGYLFNCTLNPIQTNFQDMKDFLKDVARNPIIDFDLSLKPSSINPLHNGASAWISADNDALVRTWNVTFKIDIKDGNPRLSIIIKGVFSLDVFENSTPLFQQLTGF